MTNESRLMLSPDVAAGRMRRLVDVLLPGDDLFPVASLVGTHGLVLHRLRDRIGYHQLNALLDYLSPLDSASIEQAPGVVQTIADAEPVLFAVVRNVTYMSYYASPVVIEAIRRLGHVYNDAPQPLGYTLRPFDPTPGVDLPAIPRGSYKATTDIKRLDLAAWPDLALELGV